METTAVVEHSPINSL